MKISKVHREDNPEQPVVERVSVTFAEDIGGTTTRRNTKRLSPMDSMQLSAESAAQDSDEEDYSASVNAIFQRRASTRRSKRRRDSRRTSSPFTPDVLPSNDSERRASSVFTTSSGDTAITVEDAAIPAVSQDQIFENIKLHKEVLQNVKMQPWEMRKKMKLVMQAKAYIKKHEGALQERLASSGSTKDRLARSNFDKADELIEGNHELLKKSRYDETLPTTFLIHGWTHSYNTPWMVEMREVMANQSLWNIVVVDWAHLSRTMYTEARVLSNLVGKKLCRICLYLNKMKDLEISDLHFVGHSMGAQISAMASDLIKKNLHQKVGRITALDPAAPLYEWPHKKNTDEVIDPDDAIFVDVIHTNGNYLGMISPCGHVDYYPNGGSHQPGCGFWLCSHMRAVEYWTASIKKPFLFKAYAFSSWDRYVSEKLDGVPYYPMGIAADSKIPNGIYFLETVDEVPYIHTKTTINDSL
ncbi:hypothetical protein HHI36_020976 [Cryptolaemus montrouzieri]|uniref:Lipase domain-containing protein n=1 Tax=Cryptolaemus montrouzieri TaxID=559131 RepID=A0ABD2NBX9_9CUCU